MKEDEIIVVQETEYTGAGKHIQPQLSFARQNGVDILFGKPEDEIAGQNIILPEHPGLINARDVDMKYLRTSLVRNTLQRLPEGQELTQADYEFLSLETKSNEKFVRAAVDSLKTNAG